MVIDMMTLGGFNLEISKGSCQRGSVICESGFRRDSWAVLAIQFCESNVINQH